MLTFIKVEWGILFHAFSMQYDHDFIQDICLEETKTISILFADTKVLWL